MGSPKDVTPVLGVAENRKLQKRKLRKTIVETLFRFKLATLTSDVIAKLFDLEPAEIIHKLNEFKLPLSKESVATLLGHRSQAFDIEDLENIHQILLLYRTAFYSKVKHWTPINLLEPDENFQCHANEGIIRRNIRQAFRIKGLNAIVQVTTHEEMIWIMIIEKKLTRNKGVKHRAPVFLCYEVGTPYIFVTLPIPTSIIECILKAMQYKKHKVQQLESKDIKSMLSILKNKVKNGQALRLINYEPVEAEAEVGHRNIDFINSKVKSRTSYVNRLFGTKDPIILDTFSVNADTSWLENMRPPEMAGERFEVSLQLKSSNVVDMVKYMVEIGMVAAPLPEYILTILRSGKNKVFMNRNVHK